MMGRDLLWIALGYLVGVVLLGVLFALRRNSDHARAAIVAESDSEYPSYLCGCGCGCEPDQCRQLIDAGDDA